MSVDPRHPGGDPYTPRDRRPRDVAYAEDRGSPGIGESRDPDQLQDEIELLQNRMADRLDRVSSAFTPQNMIAQVTGEKNPDIFTTIDTVADAARRNPIAAGLIGAGMVALLFNSRKTLPEPDPEVLARERAVYGVEGVTADGRRFAPSGVRGADGRVHPSDEAVGLHGDIGDPDVDDRAPEPDSIDGVEHRVKRLQDRAAARLSAASHAVSDAYDEGRARVRSSYESARSRFSSDPNSPTAMDWVRENPVPLGLAALAAGAVAAGYYTASRPSPRRRAIPRDHALVPLEDERSVTDEYLKRDERDTGRPMPVSAAAPSPMGTGITRTATIGGSGQMAGTGSSTTDPARPAGSSSRTSSPNTPDSKASGTATAKATSTTGATPASGTVHPMPQRSAAQSAADRTDDASDSTVELTQVYPRG